MITARKLNSLSNAIAAATQYGRVLERLGRARARLAKRMALQRKQHLTTPQQHATAWLRIRAFALGSTGAHRSRLGNR